MANCRNVVKWYCGS